MRDTSRWRGPHAQMHHYHSTLGNSSRLLTGPDFSLAALGRGRRGSLTAAHSSQSRSWSHAGIVNVDDFLLNARIKSLPLCSLIFVWRDGKVNGVFAAHKTTAVEMSLILVLSLTESNYCTCMAPLQAFWCCCSKVPTVFILTHRFVFHRKASAVIALPVKATFTKGLLQGRFCCRTVYGTEFTLLSKTYFTGAHIFKLLLLSNQQSSFTILN